MKIQVAVFSMLLAPLEISEFVSSSRKLKARFLLGVFLTGLALCSLLNAQSAKELKNEREKIAKLGIKTRTATHYRFNEESGKYKRAFYNKWTSKYDENGNPIERVKYDADGKLSSRKFSFKYDENGNLIERAEYDADGKLSRKLSLKYDENGNSIELAEYDADGKLLLKGVSKYDERENQIEDAYYGADGKLSRKVAYKYGENGNLIENAVYSADDKLLMKFSFKYDGMGNRIEFAKYDAFGTFLYKHIYKYDDGKGNLVEDNIYDIKDGKEIPQSQTVYEYTFYDKEKK